MESPDDHEPTEFDVSTRVLTELTAIAVRARAQIMGDIAEHVGPRPGDTEASSLYGVVLGVCLGDLVQREPNPDRVAHLVNALWTFSRWPLRIDISRVR